MIHVNYEKCVGCEACVNICPQKCIQMKEKGGFYYPQIDEARCVSCGLCEKVCLLEQADAPANQSTASAPRQTLAAYAKSEDVRLQSSSGGVFYYLASYIFSIGGVVFGAAFAEDLSVHHVCAKNLEELKPLMRSKYVQSRLGSAYAQTQDYLKKGVPVLFTGTPCQIDGLKSFLRRQEYDNLYLVCVACHGVPSEKVWQKYLHYLGVKPASRVNFRNKKDGWANYSVTIGDSSRPFFQDPYMQLFLGDFTLRPSCYACPSKAKTTPSCDLIIADFWGIQQMDPSMFDNKGTALLLVYSEKGEKLVNSLQNDFVVKTESFSEALQHNPSIFVSAKRPAKRDACMHDLLDTEAPDFARIAKKYCAPKRRLIRLLKRVVKKVLRVFHVI